MFTYLLTCPGPTRGGRSEGSCSDPGGTPVWVGAEKSTAGDGEAAPCSRETRQGAEMRSGPSARGIVLA